MLRQWLLIRRVYRVCVCVTIKWLKEYTRYYFVSFRFVSFWINSSEDDNNENGIFCHYYYFGRLVRAHPISLLWRDSTKIRIIAIIVNNYFISLGLLIQLAYAIKSICSFHLLFHHFFDFFYFFWFSVPCAWTHSPKWTDWLKRFSVRKSTFTWLNRNMYNDDDECLYVKIISWACAASATQVEMKMEMHELQNRKKNSKFIISIF